MADSLPEMSIEKDDSCYDVSNNLQDYFPWVYNAPFTVRNVNEEPLLTVDIGNSLPIHIRGFQRNLGDLRLGIQHVDCVDIISSESIPYTTEMWLETTGGV